MDREDFGSKATFLPELSLTAGRFDRRGASAQRRPQHLFDILGTGRQHYEAIETKRDPGARRQAVLEGSEKILVYRVSFAVERLFFGLVCGKARALLGGVCQFAKGVGEFEPADIDLEALGNPRVPRAAPRECGHRQGIVVKDRRSPNAESGLDPLQKNAKIERLPIVSRVWFDPQMA